MIPNSADILQKINKAVCNNEKLEPTRHGAPPWKFCASNGTSSSKNQRVYSNEQNDGRKTKKQKTEEQDPEWTTEDTKKKRKRPRNKKPTNGAKKRKTN